MNHKNRKRFLDSRALARPNSPFSSNACHAGYGPCDIEHQTIRASSILRCCFPGSTAMLLFADFLCFFYVSFFPRQTQNSMKKKNKTNNKFKGGKVAMLKCFCCLATKLFIFCHGFVMRPGWFSRRIYNFSYSCPSHVLNL